MIVTSQILKEVVDVPEAKLVITLGRGARTDEYLQRLERSLRKKDLLQATLIEMLVRDTLEEREIAEREDSTDSK